jgi:phenylacetate-CoA ligase
VLARADDMVNIRGVNVYPASVESIVRRFAEVAEFRSTVSWTGPMRSLVVDVEAAPGMANAEDLAANIARELRIALGLTVPVRLVEADTLPRFEMKARRFVVEA